MVGANESLRNLLILHPNMAFGGAERQLLNLVRALPEMGGYTVTVALYELSGMLATELEAIKNVRVVDLCIGRKSSLTRIRVIRHFILDNGFDVVYSFLVGPNLLSALARFMGAKHFVVWGHRVSSFKYLEFGWKGVWASLLTRALVHQAELIISNSEAGKQDLLRRCYPTKKIKVVPNGIDTIRFQENPAKRERFRAELGLTPNQLVVGQIGRIVPWKGHDTFLRAASILKKQIPDVVFLIVGSGEEDWVNHLQSLAEKLDLADALRWPGAMENVEDALNILDILTVSSRSGEGFPNIIGEAMAVGVPVVGSDVGEIAALLRDIGLLFHCDDPEDLATVWRRLALDVRLRGEMRSASRRLVEKEFSITKMVERTASLLDAVGSTRVNIHRSVDGKH